MRVPARPHTPAQLRYALIPSPIDELLLVADEQGLCGVYMREHKRGRDPEPDWARDEQGLAGVRTQLDQYFAGLRERFDVCVSLHGTPFQQSVWAALAEIPFGETVSYSEIAQRIGRPRAVRAVGAANARNPISLILPCHRVVGAGARAALTGYAGGLERKRWLLDHERRVGSAGAGAAG
ncbi:MAG TPA: methylated-DNA--[protein]-cysteine S-methyltransferase [Solirubrobacteraceae bacterium]|nr:methylated-DNA--[protein]-cysteine S-methyltransferase [Solirubrobacteraceae bacterium]